MASLDFNPQVCEFSVLYDELSQILQLKTARIYYLTFSLARSPVTASQGHKAVVRVLDGLVFIWRLT